MPNTVRAPRNSTVLPARKVSWNSSACSSIGPVVGRLSTMAVIASPDTIAGSSQPTVLISGLMAMRTG